MSPNDRGLPETATHGKQTRRNKTKRAVKDGFGEVQSGQHANAKLGPSVRGAREYAYAYYAPYPRVRGPTEPTQPTERALPVYQIRGEEPPLNAHASPRSSQRHKSPETQKSPRKTAPSGGTPLEADSLKLLALAGLDRPTSVFAVANSTRFFFPFLEKGAGEQGRQKETAREIKAIEAAGT